MKKKICFILFSCLLLFAAACGATEEAVPTPTPEPTATSTPMPTSTPTPTPIPENLAHTNLKALNNMVKLAASTSSEKPTESFDGLGYDLHMELVLGKDFAESIGATGLNSIGLDGTVDIHDALSSHGMFTMNNKELVSYDMYSDFRDLFFSLPKYSSQYFTYSLEELLGASLVEGEVFQGDTALDGAGAAAAAMSDEESKEFLLFALQGLVDCFQPEIGIESGKTIGIGNYVITADRHTVRATKDRITAFVAELQKEAAKYPSMDFTLDDYDPETVCDITLYYYSAEDGSFAWEILQDDPESNLHSSVFVYTPGGFCLYDTYDNGSCDMAIYSETVSDTSGLVTITGDEERDDSVFQYIYTGNSFQLQGALDDLNILFNCSVEGMHAQATVSLSDEEFSIYCESVIEGSASTLSVEVISEGMLLGTLTVSMEDRDYQAPVCPTNVTDIDTWVSGLDYELFAADFMQIISEYKFLSDAFFGTEEEQSSAQGSYVPDASYSDPFMNMTGYTYDEYGYVDFVPLEEEVFAIGKPSTGLVSTPIIEEQLTAMADYAMTAYPQWNYLGEPYYAISGSIEENDVASYYMLELLIYDTTNYDNSISIVLEAITEELVAIYVYDVSKEKAVQEMNALINVLGVDHTLTWEEAENGIILNNLCFFTDYEDGVYKLKFLVNP